MKTLNLTLLTGLIFSLVWSPEVFPQKSGHYQCLWESGLKPEVGEAFIDQMQYDDKSTLMFYFSNDDTNLYVHLIISDKASLQKVMRFGMTTWFNPDAKKKKGLGIQFPVPGIERSGLPFQKQGQIPGDRKEMMMGLMAAKNKQMVLIGFSGKGIRDTIEASDGEFHAKLVMLDRDKLLISLSLPIIKIESTGKDQSDKLLSIGFETGYLDLNRQGMGQSTGGQTGQGVYGSGMYGGPPPGSSGTAGLSGEKSNNGNGQPDISALAKPTRLWVSPVKLAEK